MYSERYSSPLNPMDAATQQHGFMSMSTTVDGLSYTPSEEEKIRDAEQLLATGRKTWKTIKGKAEAVWPFEVEAALIEALQKYQVEGIGLKTAQKSGRFPMRNRFISDYIYKETGKCRTPKQVGSRLQQMRDTSKGKKMLQLISQRGAQGGHASGSQSDSSLRASTTPPPDLQAPSPVPKLYIHVMISLQKELTHCPVPAIRFIENDQINPLTIKLSPLSDFNQVLAYPNLSCLSGTVEFPSPYALVLQSSFLVYLDDSATPLHSEIGPLRCLSSPVQQSGWLYSSEIAPEFWDTLCCSPDLTRYTIVQSLKPIPTVDLDGNIVAESTRTSPNIFILYRFGFQEPAVQTSFNTIMTPPPYPVSYPISSSTYDQPGESTVNDYTQWRVPPEEVDTKFNYAQLPLPSQQTEMSFGVAIQAAYNTSQPPPVSIQGHGYPLPVDSHPQINSYNPSSTSNSGSWNEWNSGQGRYWQRRH